MTQTDEVKSTSTTRPLLLRFLLFASICLITVYAVYTVSQFTYLKPLIYKQINLNYRQRQECSCSRPQLFTSASNSTSYSTKNQPSFCNHYATQRGPNQRIISISLYGPKENKAFTYNNSIKYLNQLIDDINTIYPDNFVLRIYHDDTINFPDMICPFECRHPNIDFCNMNSKLFIPPKIWRFIPAGDPLVDVMMSRDLDSAITRRERAAVNAWLASNKSFHSMRDHPMHGVPMLGGMWGFRPSLNPSMSHLIHEKIHNKKLIKRYGGTGDQTFLSNEVWPQAKSSVLAHDSFLCQQNFGQKSDPFPTQRPSANETNCFIGCMRPCCGNGKMPFGECPMQCRPKDHPEWKYC